MLRSKSVECRRGKQLELKFNDIYWKNVINVSKTNFLKWESNNYDFLNIITEHAS